ncbi:uncharacterized protein LOC125075553 [Vanessa atalanta]|uniref:uncharacterized protein LOC125075553 n=1 Tax=Vanessa atalanta TaxID=42275 RepID=UPI001FCCDF30|nr:uncharacterized protein LOC125075553 [Vanessa atalanta]
MTYTSNDTYFWQCPECKPKRGNADNTPVCSGNSTSKLPDEDNITRRKKESMKFMNEQYEDIKSEIRTKFKAFEILNKENEQLKVTIQDLDMRLNVMEQQSRACNIELQCLPEHKNENLINTIMQLSRVISCNITEDNIHNVTRIAKQNPNSSRPKSIIVQFNSPRTRDTFLAASIKYNKNNPDDKLNSKLLGIGGLKQNIYVVEHLSPKNKMLHAAAKQKAKLKGYRYVWVRNGRIFMRKSDNCEYKHIKDMASLDKID